MADPNWRRPPSSSGGGVPFGVPKVQQQQQQEGAPTNGQQGGHGSQFPAQTQTKFHSSSGIAGRGAHTPQGGTFAPPSHSSLAAVGAPSSISSARGGERPPYVAGASNGVSGFAPPPRQQSPFSANGARMSSPPATAPPGRYGSGPPVGGAAPASTGSAMLGGGALPPPPPPPTSNSGPPSLSRGYSPAPTQNAFSKPSMSAPPAGPPLTWSGNGTGIAAPTGGNGHAHHAPPGFLPPQGPPSSSSGVGVGVVGNGGHAFGNGTAPQSAPMYGARGSAAPPMAAPGQYDSGYTNGGIPPPLDSTRPKIKPEQIPRPVVSSSEEVTYRTCTPPSVMLPPPPTSNYVAIDEGNCSPRFIRSTMAQLPITADAMGACKIPMAVVIQPMALVGPNEEPVNLVDFGESGPLRCDRCRAYVNSFAKYVQNGEKWVCNFCKHEGDVPQTYRCPLDAAGLRRDRQQRAELCRGSVDFVVPKAVYSLRPEQQPIFVFCVDVSPRSLETGFTAACLSAIEASLDEVPGGERARVGLMTFDRSLHVYRFDEEGGVSQMVVAADIEEPFAPLPPSQWIMPLHTCRSGLPRLFASIPGLVVGDGRQMSPASACASGAALRATADCLEGIGGRIFLLAQSPSDTGAGKVSRGREDAGMYAGEKEFRMYQPAGDAGKDVTALASGAFYKALAKDCATRQVCVDLMLWSSVDVREFYDVGTIGVVPRATGGRVTYVRGGEAGGLETMSHLRQQLRGALRDHGNSGSESVLKVRCTAGMACTQRLGPGVENMPGELEVATITPQHAIVCRLEHDGRKVQEGEMIYIQSALLYTSTSGQRRVRCHTLGLPVTGVVETLFRSADVETVSAVMARQAVSQALNNKVVVDVVRKQVEESMLAMLFSYRKKCASNSSSGQLILPETLRLLPLYTLCTHKMVALRPNSQGSALDVRADERAARLLASHTMPVVDMVQLLYPSLYSVHDLAPEIGDAPPLAPPPPADTLEGGPAERGVEGLWGRPLAGVDCPVALPPTSEKLTSDGVFLLDAGDELMLYVGRSVGGEVMSELFGVDGVPGAGGVGGGPGSSGYGAVSVRLRLREEEGYEQARRLRNVIEHLRRGCAAHKPLVVVVANSSVADEARFASLMAEDKTKQGTSYVDELCNLHHKIQSKMR